MGRKQTEETKKKISKNHSRFWYGKKLPQEMIEKIRKSRTGKKIAPRSALGKQRMREAWVRMKKKGIKPPVHNTPHSEESKKKMSLSHIGIQRGNKSPHWRGGLTLLSKLIRESFINTANGVQMCL